MWLISPRRHYAAAELQMMLAHIVTTHDVKMEKEGVCPWSYHIRDTNIPVPMVGYNAVVWALYLAFVRGI